MKKLGLGKKSGDDVADDQSRSKLFGRSSKSKDKGSTSSPNVNPYAQQAPSGGNPYAQQQQGGHQQDPYRASAAPSINSSYAPSTTSYQSDSTAYGDHAKAPPPYTQPRNGDYGGFVDERNDTPAFPNKSPVPQGGYGGSGGSRYANNSYGSQSGYGADRYGAESGSSSSQPRQGGYGGLGRTATQDTTATDAARDQLFGNARERVEKKQNEQGAIAPEEREQSGSGFDGGMGGAGGYSEYGQYHERALTAEEEEEQDVKATKDQIRFLKQQDVASTRNALRIAAQAEETGRATLARLGQQGEAIHNAEKNLDLASNQNRIAEEKARELKRLNRSMFAPNVSNPFTKSRRLREADEQIMNTHHSERGEREATRAAAFQQQSRQAEAARNLRGSAAQEARKKNLAGRSKFQFEPDSEDEALEDEIDSNLDALTSAAGRLNVLGKAMGREVDEQNAHIERIGQKADRVDDQIVMNRARLDRIH